MKLCKLLLVAVGATMLLGALVTSASARNLSISNQRIRMSWREVIFEAPFGNTSCGVVLEGSFHTRTIAKVIGTLMGYITSAVLGACLVGTATILRETLPWHIKYSGFEPRLPEIRSIITHFIGSSFRVQEPFGVACLYRSEANEPVVRRFHREPVTHQLIGVSVGGTVRTGPECFEARARLSSSEGTISGQGGTNTLIFVSLI